MMTQPRRRVAATLALIFFSIAPTAYVAARACHLRRPAHLREVEAELGRRLGVLASVSRVSHPRPDVDVLGGVSLRLDDAGHAEIARAEEVRISREGDEITLRVEELMLRGEDAPEALARAVAVLRRLGSSGEGRLNLMADRCELAMGEGVESLRDLVATCRVVKGVPALSASYLIGDEARTRCEMSLRHETGGRGSTTVLAFKTLDGSIPSRLLSPFFDAPSWLGSSARVEGALTLTRAEGKDWRAGFRGELIGVDLSALIGRRFAGHRMTGTARVAIDSADWSDRPGGQGPGWVEARGSISSGPGSISPALLSALESRMRFRLTDPVAPPSRSDVEFQGLGLSFAMDSSGELRIGGGLGPDHAPDAVLVMGHRASPLARSPRGASNVRGLWNALLPSTPETLAPAVPEAHALRYLPLPPSRPGPMSAN